MWRVNYCSLVETVLLNVIFAFKLCTGFLFVPGLILTETRSWPYYLVVRNIYYLMT